MVWDRATGTAVHRAIVWQDRRTADICATLKSEGFEPAISAKTGLIIDPYFSGTKVAWILDHVPGARARAERGELMFGTVDCYLLWRLTAGKVHATDATNASRTLLFNIHTGEWDDELLKILRVPRSMLPEVKDSSHHFGDSVPELFGGPIAISGIAGDQQAATIGQACFAPGMMKSTYGTGLFCHPEHRRHAGGLQEQAADHDRLSIEWQAHLCAGRLDLRRRVVGAMVARRARHHQAGQRNRTARRPVRFHPERLSGAGLCRPGRALLESAGARRAVRADAKHRSGRIRHAALESVCYQTFDLWAAMRADWPEANAANIVLRVDGGMAASNWTMQRLADLLDAPVDRPMIQETTALGAAYLAGLNAGVYPEPSKFADNWRLEHRFKPNMSQATRERKLKGWARAVKGVLASDEGEG